MLGAVKTAETNAAARAETRRLWPALLAAGLGLVLIYTAGFAPLDVLHSSAHDTRHSAGFPCH